MSRRILIGLLWAGLLMGYNPANAADSEPAGDAKKVDEAAPSASEATAVPEAAEPPESSAPTAGPQIERIEMAPEPMPKAPRDAGAPAPAEKAPSPKAEEAPPRQAPPIPAEIERAAAEGDADAQLELGILYHYGFGLKGNKIEALAWYLAAADQGNAKAIALRDKLLKELGPKSIAAARAKSKGIRRKSVAPPPARDADKLGPPGS